MPKPFETRRGQSKANPELRRLTVLFCDIIGSTELGAGLDIEDYSALIYDFQDLCRQRIEETGGWLAQFQGDGVLAYFGYPTMFEDSAKRAVLAGLSIAETLESHSFRLPSTVERRLTARISAHTGPVLTRSDTESTAQLPEGISINIAKKIQSFAPDNTVVVTAETQELIQQYFDLKGPRSVEIDKVETDLQIYEVIGERPEARLPGRRLGGNLPPFVARYGELQFIDDRWEMAQQGLGQSLVLVGEAGIGKSRLIHEFKRRNEISDERWYEIGCTPDTADSAFFPFREFFASRLSGPALANLGSLRRRVAAHLKALAFHSEENEQALMSLLGALPKATESTRVFPAVIRQRINNFLTGYFFACCEKRPLVLVFEDLHWADASTGEIVETLASRCQGASILIVCAQRPEGGHPFSGRASVTSLVLNPLPPLHVKELVDNLSDNGKISERRAQELFRLTGGNPLFVEQYVASTGAYQEIPLDRSTPGVGDDLAITPKRVPPTLHELIAHRLEQLGDAKPVAQCAAVLGQFIYPRTLQKVLNAETAEFERKIETLVRSGVLAYTDEASLPQLRFRHALIREAAYETLLGSQRRRLHRLIAEQLVQEQPDNDLIPHEVIARHFALAQEPRQSITHWKLAATHASARFANDEALSHLGEALTQVEALPADEAETLEIEVREALTVPLEAMRGWAANETESNLKRLLELRTSRADEVGVFSVYHALCSMHGIRGEVTKGLSYAEKMQAIADRSKDLALRVLSLRVSGIFYFLISDFPTSLRLFEQLASIYTDEIRERVSAYYPANPLAIGHAFSAWALALMGQEKEAIAAVAKARGAISSEKDDFTKAYVEGFASSVFLALGQHGAGIASASTCLQVSKEHSFDYWTSWSKIILGYCRLLARIEEEGALSLMEEGLNAYKSTGSRQLLPYAIGLFADALIRSGKTDRALTVIGELELEREDNEVSFFDDFNRKLIEWRATTKS